MKKNDSNAQPDPNLAADQPMAGALPEPKRPAKKRTAKKRPAKKK